MTDPLVHEFTVGCSPEHAFRVWAERTSTWWPASHSVSGAPEAVVLEPHAGGRIYERAPGGEEHDWGRVLAWEPPRRLVYSWHLRQDAADATEVEITFAASAGGCAVTITHRGWERLGAKGPSLRERNVRGWAGLLPAYLSAVANGTVDDRQRDGSITSLPEVRRAARSSCSRRTSESP